jgi:DNA-binding IclR family transcriptional regulator
MRLSDVAVATRLHKATAFRVLTALIQEGFVEQDEAKGYHLGAAIWTLGMAAARRFDIRQMAARALDRITEASGDTAFLSIRSGLDAICIDRREGSFPIRTLTLEVGSRRPLGVGAGSLALLAFLPAEEVESVIAANANALRRYPGFARAELQRLVAATRAKGYSFNDGRIIEGMSAVGVPVLDHLGRPAVALSCAAISSRMGPERRATIVRLLLKEARAIEKQLSPRSADPPLATGTR